MNKTEKISLEEKRQIQLTMVDEIDAFCRLNNIRYSLAYGTLIGAIRHKGFIPWDDDLDLMMPISDMMKFKSLFKSDNIEYIDIDKDFNYEFIFSRLYHTKTFEKIGKKKELGINIDLYPIIDIPDDVGLKDEFFSTLERLNNIRYCFMKWNRRFKKHLSIKLPFTENAIRKAHDFCIKNTEYGKTGMYYIISGPVSRKDWNIFDYDLFKNTIIVDFEGHKYSAIAEYDSYLRHVYGDYMQLPPIEKRVPYHGGDYYWK